MGNKWRRAETPALRLLIFSLIFNEGIRQAFHFCAARDGRARIHFAEAVNGRLADEMDIYFCSEIRQRGNLSQERGSEEGAIKRRGLAAASRSSADSRWHCDAFTGEQRSGCTRCWDENFFPFISDFAFMSKYRCVLWPFSDKLPFRSQLLSNVWIPTAASFFSSFYLSCFSCNWAA